MQFQPGQVRDAVVACLKELGPHGGSLEQIYEYVASSFSSPAPKSSIRSYLQLNTPTVFERLGRGHYRLMSSQSESVHSLKALRAVFTHGSSRLFHADAIEWLRAQPGESIHGVVTDPPYGLVEYTPLEQAKLRAGKGGTWRIPPAFDGHTRAPLPRFTTLSPAELKDLDTFFTAFGEALLPALVPGAYIVMAANPLLSHLVSYALDRSGFERRGEIVRLVTTMRGGDRPKNAHEEFPDVSVMPRSMWEPWLLFRKPLEGTVANNLRIYGTGGLRRISAEQPFGDVIRSSPTQPREREIANHPSLKPQAFLRQVVRAVLPLGKGTVLDPFAGSGSTLAAAESLGYKSIGVERDPQYIAIAKQAIAALAALPDRPLQVLVQPELTELGDSMAI